MGTPTAAAAVEYPDSDGQPMSDNTRQYDWMATLKWAAEAQFRDRPDVFVAGDHLIYATLGDPTDRLAPDVYVAFGRPKGDRGSYKLWEEAGVFPQVIFEVWSPSNTAERMEEQQRFYDRNGADEYYVVYPDFPVHARGWRRDGGKLTEIDPFDGYVSPRLGWRFEVGGGAVTVYGPDGRPLERPDVIYAERDEIAAERDEIAAERDEIAAERERVAAALDRESAARIDAERDRQRAEREAERQRTETERLREEANRQRVEAERQRTEAERLAGELAGQQAEAARLADELARRAAAGAAAADAAARMAAKLRALGLDPDAV